MRRSSYKTNIVISTKMSYRIAKQEMIRQAFLDDIKQFAQSVSKVLRMDVKDLLKLFVKGPVLKFFKKIKWSFEKIWKLLKTGWKAYQELYKAIDEYMAETRVGKWTNEKLKEMDEWLKNHPKVKRMGGPAIAAIIIYLWFQMSFTGDFEFDFDFSDVLAALSGSYALSEIFTPRFLMAVAAGVFIGASFPWPGPQTVHFIGSILYSVGKAVGVKLKRASVYAYETAHDLKASMSELLMVSRRLVLHDDFHLCYGKNRNAI